MKRESHHCPRCFTWTGEKFYCKACQAVLKKPRLMLPTTPYFKLAHEWR